MEAQPQVFDQTYQDLLNFSRKYPINGPIAIQIYLDLKKVKLWEVLAPKENQELNLLYFSGKVRQERGNAEYIVPLAAHSNLSMALMHNIFTKLEGGTLKDVIYAFIDSDSAIAYYRLYNTIVPPTELKLVVQRPSAEDTMS